MGASRPPCRDKLLLTIGRQYAGSLLTNRVSATTFQQPWAPCMKSPVTLRMDTVVLKPMCNDVRWDGRALTDVIEVALRRCLGVTEHEWAVPARGEDINATNERCFLGEQASTASRRRSDP